MSYSNRRIALVLVLSLALPLGVATPALADDIAAQVTTLRGSSLPVVAAPDQVAAASAAAQAAAGKLSHADLSGLLGTCESVGEVVGSAPDVPGIFAAFRESSPHRNIITNPAWTAIGTGLASAADGTAYVSVVFCHLAGDQTPPADSPPAAFPPAAAATSAAPTPVTIAIPEVAEPGPVLEGILPPIQTRRAEIRARLDRQARSMLPDWYIGVCGTGDRDRVLAGRNSDSGACPNAA